MSWVSFGITVVLSYIISMNLLWSPKSNQKNILLYHFCLFSSYNGKRKVITSISCSHMCWIIKNHIWFCSWRLIWPLYSALLSYLLYLVYLYYWFVPPTLDHISLLKLKYGSFPLNANDKTVHFQYHRSQFRA